jgi:PAS domain S-box-containing protein
MASSHPTPTDGLSGLDALLPSPADENRGDWKAFSKALLNASRNGIFVVDPLGTVIVSNRQVQKSLSLFPGSLLPTTMPDFWPHAAATLQDRRHRRGITVHGKGVAYLASLMPMRLKNAPACVLCVLEDRTELEEMTRRMHTYQELSRELDAIIDSSDDGLWICDADGTVLRINAASERINMIRAETVVGRNMREIIKEGFIDRSVTLAVIASGRRRNMIQRTHSGRKLMVTGNPVFNRKGEMIRVVANERDMTEIDALQRELEEQVAIKDQMQNQMLEMQLMAHNANRVVAFSPNMIKTLHQAFKLSRVDTTVLLLGESGAGKGVVADLIHQHSDRASQPMIKINCGAIPETLVETELFGYEKGAFTGADQRGKAGHLELAHQGILFLDEIAELPPSSQVKLLRFLEDGRIARVGGTTSRKLDVRILCATNQDLSDMVARGSFRQDLYYRLHVIPLRVPPLRDRKDCILPLIQHFLDRFSERLGLDKPPRISRRAMDVLMTYPYPGNVRELMNLCERMVVMAEGRRLDLADLPTAVTAAAAGDGDACAEAIPEGSHLPAMLAAVERRILTEARTRYGSQARMARALGVNQSTIARKLKKLGL